MSLSFSMPEGMIDLSGDSASGGQKKDEPQTDANAQEMALSGMTAFDIQGIDLDTSSYVREQYYDNLLQEVNLQVSDIDVVSMKQGTVGSEAAAQQILDLASTTSDKLGRNDRLELATDRLLQARSGSREVQLSPDHREAGWEVFDPERQLGIYQHADHEMHTIGEGRHDQDGVYSDVRAILASYAIHMNDMGIDFGELNGALSKGGTLESLDQMRDALSGLNTIAMNRAGFAGFGAFFQALDADLFERQKADNPRADVRPALGTPEPEVTPPQMAYNMPDQQPGGPNGPGTGGPGMSFRAPG